jgi:carbamoyltransferase
VLIAGLSGGARHACAALAEARGVVAVCAQERVTRVRGAGVNGSGVPDEALDLLLARSGRTRRDVERFAAAGRADSPVVDGHEPLAHAFAHACTAYLSSPFTSAVIVVCDQGAPGISVWVGSGASVTPVDWPWDGPGLVEAYGRCAAAFGFGAEVQRFEALARLGAGARDARVDRMLPLGDAAIDPASTLEGSIEAWLAGDRDIASPARIALAAALQTRIGELYVELLARVRRQVGNERLCIGGSFAAHSSMNTAAAASGLFSEVFVPVDPGNAGLAVGAALHASGRGPSPVSPFLGPSYSDQETKETLDNCKLQYSWEHEDAVLAAAVRALQDGRLVAWFDGAMEWGPRALGARCILASPAAPYVLENLNRFLKRREPWRGYALSGLEEAVAGSFTGPAAAPFMEYDYHPRDAERFRHVLPAAGAAVRVHTVDRGTSPRFRRLIETFAAATGMPFLVNTSFNGFNEPIVCSPRDAVRVFYGSGIDMLVLNHFVIAK